MNIYSFQISKGLINCWRREIPDSGTAQSFNRYWCFQYACGNPVCGNYNLLAKRISDFEVHIHVSGSIRNSYFLGLITDGRKDQDNRQLRHHKTVLSPRISVSTVISTLFDYRYGRNELI